MNRAIRWLLAGAACCVVFCVTAGVTGLYLLRGALDSTSDRWVVATGVGTAAAAVAGLWGATWAEKKQAASSPATLEVQKAPDATPPYPSAPASPAGNEPVDSIAGKRSVVVRGDNVGIVALGDDTINVQDS